MAFRSMPTKQLAFQRSRDGGRSWDQLAEMRTDIKLSGEEWSLHVLQTTGTVLLTDGSGGMVYSHDNAKTFNNVTGVVSTDDAGGRGKEEDDKPFRFNCSDECGSWSVIEVTPEDDGGGELPPGVYFFVDRAMWQSVDDAHTWHLFSQATAASGHMPRSNEFFSQSQIYRRRDGSWLHSARMNTAPCDSWAGEQLWQSNDTDAIVWHCRTQAAGGFCNAASGPGKQTGHTPAGCYHQADKPIQCADSTHSWLKPGNHYSRWLRLRDGRLLLTWSHRSYV